MRRSLFLLLFNLLIVGAALYGQARVLEVESYGGGVGSQLVGDSGKRKVALVVGISAYSSEPLKLKYAARDAQLFRDYLASVRQFPDPNIFFMPDSLATAGKIYNQIRTLMQALTSGDEFVIYFAGHGDVQTFNDFSEAFLLAWDASGSRNYKGLGGAVDMEDLQRYTNHLATRKKVKVSMVLDACHSGFDQYRDGILKAQQNITEQFQSVNKWTGCAVDELSFEADSIGHGLFTWYLVQGLMGLADDPIDNAVTPEELARFVTSRVEQATRGKQHPQLNLATGGEFRYLVDPEIRERALAYFKNRQYNQAFAGRGVGSVPDTTGPSILRTYIDRYNRFLAAGSYYGSDSSSLSVIGTLNSIPSAEAEALQAGLKHHLAEVLETRSQLVLNEYLKGKSQIPSSASFHQAGVESALADSLLDLDDPRKKSNQVMSAFHQAFSYLRYEQFEKFGEAESLLRHAINLEPKAAYLYVTLAYLMDYRKQYDSAFVYLRKASDIIPTWTHPQNMLGNLYEAQYRYQEAIEQHRKVLNIDSNYIWSYNNLGLAYLNMGRVTEAERYFTRSLEMKNRSSRESIQRDLAISYNNLGAIYDERKQFSKAESFFKKAVAIDSTYSQPLRNLSQLYESYDGTEAEYLLKRCIEIMPYESVNYHKLGDFYRNYPDRAGVLDSAAILYQRAIELNPYDPAGYIGMGNLAYDLDQRDSGIIWMQKGLAVAPGQVDLLNGLAIYYELVGVADSANQYYQLALTKNPYDFDIGNGYADFLLDQRDTLLAEQILLKYESLLSGVPKYFYLLGDFYYRIGQLDKAVSAYQKVVSIDSLYQPAWEALMYLYLPLNRVTESRAILMRLKTMDGYATILSSYLQLVGEICHRLPQAEQLNWLKSFESLDPLNLYLTGLRLECAYAALSELRPAFDRAWRAAMLADYQDDALLRILVVAAVELAESKKLKLVAGWYLDQVLVPEPAVQILALSVTGNEAEARRLKKGLDPAAIAAYGPEFKKRLDRL